MNRDQYSKIATRDLRSSMALALANKLKQLVFNQPAAYPFSFVRVFEEWPSYGDKYVPPSACVTPTPWRYDDARLTPSLCPGTWEPQGFQGFGLYAVSEVTATYEVSIRCVTVAEREAIIKGIEEGFFSFGGDLMPLTNRYGVLLPMPTYYGMDCRFAVTAARVVDDEQRAMRNQQEAVFSFEGQALQVVLGPVRPFHVYIETRYCTDAELAGE